jgi:CBS domain-containing protein
MKVRDIITEHPTCATADQTLADAARMMKECDCGAIPVVEDQASRRPLGIITDRDIVIRGIAEGRQPSSTAIQNCMTKSLVTASPDDDLDECAKLMEKHQVRRILVVENDAVAGIVAQAHIARNASRSTAGNMVQEISEDR